MRSFLNGIAALPAVERNLLGLSASFLDREASTLSRTVGALLRIRGTRLPSVDLATRISPPRGQ